MLVNYHDMVRKNVLTKGQERMLSFFWSHHPKKWTVGEIFQQFRAKYPTISINSIAPRISELKTKKLLEVVGEKIYQHQDPITKKHTTKKQNYLRLIDYSLEPSFFD